jgi:DNA-binding NtrC family response regulator
VKQTRILIVDDDPLILELVAEQLGEHGYSVATAGGVEAAMAVLAAEAPVLVLADIRMTPRDGFDLLGEVRGRFPKIPVVLMSSLFPPGAAARASRAGAAGFLRKPFTEAEMLKSLSDALVAKGPPIRPGEGVG